jgi:hypothetical protein
MNVAGHSGHVIATVSKEVKYSDPTLTAGRPTVICHQNERPSMTGSIGGCSVLHPLRGQG